MSDKVRIGAVSYLNTRPLVFGLERGTGAERVILSYDVPATVADRMLHDELDIALLPSIELARIPELEVVPGLGISSFGPARSVKVVSKRQPAEVRRVAMDPESRTTNALARVVLEEFWGADPVYLAGSRDLEATLESCDAAVRIGDKALFEPVPEGTEAYDLGEAWTARTGLPFVYAVWAARPGVLDRELYRALHDSRRTGMRALEQIVEAYTWNGRTMRARALEYLRHNIRYRLGSPEVQGLKSFLAAAARRGIIGEVFDVRMALTRWTACHEAAAANRSAPKRTT